VADLLQRNDLDYPEEERGFIVTYSRAMRKSEAEGYLSQLSIWPDKLFSTFDWVPCKKELDG